MIKEASWLLSNIVGGSVKATEWLISMNFLPILVQILQEVNYDIYTYILRVFNNILNTSYQNKCAVMLVELKITSIIPMILTMPDKVCSLQVIYKLILNSRAALASIREPTNLQLIECLQLPSPLDDNPTAIHANQIIRILTSDPNIDTNNYFQTI